MKKILLSLSIMTLLLSCGQSEEKTNLEEKPEQLDSVKVEDLTFTENKDLINPEETTEEAVDGRYDNLCMETTFSDCYIVSHFSDEAASYITVDFVNYKVIEGDSEPEYELVNEIKTLRTFLVDTAYFDCGRSKKVSIEKLIQQSEQNKETLFNIETDGGVVIELFVRNCAG